MQQKPSLKDVGDPVPSSIIRSDQLPGITISASFFLAIRRKGWQSFETCCGLAVHSEVLSVIREVRLMRVEGCLEQKTAVRSSDHPRTYGPELSRVIPVPVFICDVMPVEPLSAFRAPLLELGGPFNIPTSRVTTRCIC